jgi:hypothetical protein
MFHVVHFDGNYRVGRTTNGLDFTPVGPAFPEPKAAVRYARKLDAVPAISPVRSSVERPALVPVPHAGMGEPGARQTTRQGRLPDIHMDEDAG